MIFLFAAALLLGCFGIRRRHECEDPLAPSVTNAINGIFVILVLLSHFYQYAGSFLNAWPDHFYEVVRQFLGQTVVATFLFFSGYGLMEQIRKKKRMYVRSMFFHRFLKVLFHFDLALLLFLLLELILGYEETFVSLVKALLSYSKLSVGNSNWFIFTTLCLYLIVIVSFFFYREKPLPCLVAATVLTFVYVYLIVHSENSAARYYNTVFCFIGGLWFSYLKEAIQRFIRKNIFIYLISLVLCVGIGISVYFVCLGQEAPYFHLLYNVYALSVAMFWTLLSEKVVFGNPILSWLGKNTFSIYILQRIPYILFRHSGLLEYSLPLYFLSCVAGTLLLASVFSALTKYLDSLIWHRKKVS